MTLSSEWRCQSKRIGTALLLGACFVGPAAVAAETPSIQAGSVVTYRDAAGRDWCATVASVGEGAGNEPWAWLRLNADPRRVEKTPLRDLAAGCEPLSTGLKARLAAPSGAPR
jgi:hypothetical protein